MKISRLLKIFFFLFFALPLLSCEKESGGGSGSEPAIWDISKIKVPTTIEAKAGGTFTVQAPAGSVKQTDVFCLHPVNNSSVKYDCVISSVSSSSCTVVLNKEIVSGRYTCHIRRASEDRTLGLTTVRIVADDGLDPGDASVYGIVSCDGKGVENVSVSDGYELVRTDKDGVYRIKSEKKLGHVFISLPAGYEPTANGILPHIHCVLTQDKSVPERADFTLKKVDNDNHTLIVMGDIHLANRNNDRAEFRKFTADVRKFESEHASEKIYGLTLGDMTWDLYWYQNNNYFFPQYLDDMNSGANGIGNLMVFHTIGNHDHDMNEAGDLLTEVKYVKDIAPTYYSFNLGKVHYVVLDNILCTNDGKGSRTYNVEVDSDQLSWLKKDLSYVDKSTPVVVSMHAPIYYDNGSGSSLSPTISSKMKTVTNAFAGYKVHFLTGHTHRILNVESGNVFEHNAGAICASWWWTQSLSSNNVCTDGAPGGYMVWQVKGTDFSWQYLGTSREKDYQFRTYDLNNVAFDASTVDKYLPSATDWAKNRFVELYASAYPKNNSNKVLINVWNYNPKWTVSVTENGKALTVTQVKRLDPLHILSLSIPRLGGKNVKEDPNFLTVLSTHFFEVQASSATSTLEITVKDEFGNESRETMTRPKEFKLSVY